MKRDLGLTQWLRSMSLIGRSLKLHKFVNPHGWLAFFVTAIVILTSISPAIAVPTAMKEVIAAYEAGVVSTYKAYGAPAPSAYLDTTEYTVKFSQGSPNNNLKVSGFTTVADTFSLWKLTSQIRIRRQATGLPSNRQLLFYEKKPSSSPAVDLTPSKANDMESALLNTIINRGTDNIFANGGNSQGNNNNIERVDFIEPPGLTAPAAGLANVGFLILERGGNDPFKIAAIKAVDSSSNPTAFETLITASKSDWGSSKKYSSISTTVMRTDTIGTDLRPSADPSGQAISGIYFSYADLGITTGQKFYGYALFPLDAVTSNLVDWTTFPPNTSEADGGLDLIAGGGIYINQTSPVADLALQKTVDNANPAVGTNITFTLTLTNQSTTSTGDATGVQVQDSLPAGLQFVSSTSIAPYNSLTGIWNVGSLAHSSTVTLQITAKVIGSGSITNTAQVFASDQLDSDSSPNNNNPAEDDQSSATITVKPSPNLRLVKRVTAIATTPITGFNDVLTGPNAADDNAPGWITSPPYLQGAFDIAQIPPANQPKPNDEVEYTIYFLSDGSANAQNVALCDFVPNNSTYVLNSLKLSIGAGAPTAISDATGGADTDGGFYSNLSTFPIACSTGTNKGNGAVVVNVGTVDRSTGSGTPTTSYGFIRFRAKVD